MIARRSCCSSFLERPIVGKAFGLLTVLFGRAALHEVVMVDEEWDNVELEDAAAGFSFWVCIYISTTPHKTMRYPSLVVLVVPDELYFYLLSHRLFFSQEKDVFVI